MNTKPCINETILSLIMLLLCSHSHNDVPPEPQRNISMAAVRGAVRPSMSLIMTRFAAFYIQDSEQYSIDTEVSASLQ